MKTMFEQLLKAGEDSALGILGPSFRLQSDRLGIALIRHPAWQRGARSDCGVYACY